MSLNMQSADLKPCANVSLGIDEACFNILNLYYFPVLFYSIPWEAYWGSGMLKAVLPKRSSRNLVVSTKHPLHIFYRTDKNQSDTPNLEYCHTTYNFREHGNYGWNISSEQLCSKVYEIRQPSESYLPILVAFMIAILLASLWATSKVIVRVIRGKLSPDNVHDDLDRLQETESATHSLIRITRCSTRIQSVDTFRGISILLMIFVNNGGGQYVFFNHSAWFGLTVADLVLPWFAWIMGLAITISKRAELRVTITRVRITLRCLQRTFTLILLGLMLNSMDSKSLSDLRFPGVLQLLAVSYFVCATLETIFMKPHSQFGRFAMFGDILDSWPQWVVMICILVIHTLITFLLSVPGCPRGYLGPGGEYDHRGEYINCTAGAAGYIDRSIFGDHMYSKTNNSVYGTILRYDPEGLMNTVSAILIVYLGVHAGKILLVYYQCNSRAVRWILWALLTGIIAGFLCKYEQQGGVIPLSKRMMTLSFVLACSSSAFLLFTILYLLVDYKQIWSGAPFIYAEVCKKGPEFFSRSGRVLEGFGIPESAGFVLLGLTDNCTSENQQRLYTFSYGTNPIFLYVGHMLTKHLFPWAWEIASPTHASVLAMNLWTTALWTIIAYILYRKDIIITI